MQFVAFIQLVALLPINVFYIYVDFFNLGTSMPKKKKSGGKLAKMSEEERILYMEQQRLAEEEMRKKKEDMLTQFLKVRVLFE